MREVSRLLSVSVALLAVAGCGGGGGSGAAGGAPAPQTATVGIALKDAPAGGYDQALATITSIVLLGSDGPVTVFSGSETVDLLRLADYSELFAVNSAVPAGTYSKIRLQLSNLQLVKLNPDGTVQESVATKLVANGKMDLNPQGPFSVAEGATLIITIDFDMQKSLKITETGNGKLIVRPVILVDIRDGLPAPGLTRIHGLVTEIDADGTIRLCQTALASSAYDREPHGGSGRCVRARTDEATGVFGEDGLPEELADLAVGDEATIIGKLRPWDALDRRHHLDQQGDQDEQDDQDETTGGSAGEDDDSAEGYFGLDAYTIEEGPLGTYKRYAGTVAQPVDPATDSFAFDVAPGQGLVTDGSTTAQLYPKSRIFSAAGIELDRAALDTGVKAVVDSVLAISGDGPDVLRTALVTIPAAASGELVVHGSVLTVEDAGLMMSTATGDRCVRVSTATDIFLVSESGGSLDTSRGSLADLQSGQAITVFGTEGIGGCLVADAILARVD